MRWMVICRPSPASPATKVRRSPAPSSSSDRTVSAGVTAASYDDCGNVEARLQLQSVRASIASGDAVPFIRRTGPLEGFLRPPAASSVGQSPPTLNARLVLGVFFGDDLVHRLARWRGEEALAEVGVAEQPR